MEMTREEYNDFLMLQLSKRKEQRQKLGLPVGLYQHGYTPEQGDAKIAALMAMPDSEFPLCYETSAGDRLVFLSRREAVENVRGEVRKTVEKFDAEAACRLDDGEDVLLGG